MMTKVFFPRTIDVNLTSKCNLDCTFCWGPNHSIPDGLTTVQWKQLIGYFAKNGTRSVIFTGGEPLLREDVDEVIKYTYELGLYTTLSTNALLLRNRAFQVLPYVSQIGIPLDGSSSRRSELMRGSLDSFSSSLNALKLVRVNYPNIEITVRTLVSKVNIDDILNIAEILENFIDYFDRWKIYKFIPISIGSKYAENHITPISEFNSIINQLKTKSHKLRQKTVYYLPSEEFKRHLFIGSLGDLYSQINATSYKTIGNFFDLSEETLKKELSQLVDSKKNSQHGI